MNHIADACALVVFLGGGRAREMMVEGARIMAMADVGVLPTTVWEITRKVSIGKLEMPGMKSLTGLLRANGFRFLPLSWEDAEAANDLPEHHRDLMDRMLIAAALQADRTVITTDRVFERYGVRTVW